MFSEFWESIYALIISVLTRCSVLVSAFVGTAVAFCCFSGAALLARRREFLYLGGLLSSGVSMLLWLHFASSIFGGSTALFKFEVFIFLIKLFHGLEVEAVGLDLILFCLFVCFICSCTLGSWFLLGTW